MKSSHQTKKYFKQYYPKLGIISSIRNITHDDINSQNFLVKTHNTNFVLRKFQDGSNSIKIEKLCKILKFCYDNNAKVSLPITNIRNQYVDNQHNCYLTQFVKGKTFANNSTEFKDLAKQLALLHTTLDKKKFAYNYKIGHQFYKNFTKQELKKLQKFLQIKNLCYNNTIVIGKIIF